MGIQERILLALCRSSESGDFVMGKSPRTVHNSLFLLERENRNFAELVSGKRVADFGCGLGFQSIALVQKYGCTVVGIDSNPKTLTMAIELAKSHNIARDKLTFVERAPCQATFDIVLSHNSFEHFCDPVAILKEMSQLIDSMGLILVAFGPPWLAPYGSHMGYFCKVPWVNILFSENTVMKVRSRYRNDGAIRYVDVESGLNKMTVAKFEKTVAASGLQVLSKNYQCVKGIDILSDIPLLRELFVNRICALLAPVQPNNLMPPHIQSQLLKRRRSQ